MRMASAKGPHASSSLSKTLLSSVRETLSELVSSPILSQILLASVILSAASPNLLCAIFNAARETQSCAGREFLDPEAGTRVFAMKRSSSVNGSSFKANIASTNACPTESATSLGGTDRRRRDCSKRSRFCFGKPSTSHERCL
jgi:hypothetical protein